MKVGSLRALGQWALLVLAALAPHGAVDTSPSTPEQVGDARSRRESREEGRFDKAAEAQRFYALKRAPVGQTAIPAERYQAALKRMRQMPVYSSVRQSFLPGVGHWDSMTTARPDLPNLGTWSYLGPGNIGGRTRALLFHPSFASNQLMYAAGVAGGVWKSTNAGGSWTPIADTMANLAVTAMAMSPTSASTIYAGTGEGYYDIDGVRGNGIFKTTDGGATWSQLAGTNNSNFNYVNELSISGANPADVYATTRTGLWQSTDSGATWTRILNPGVTPGTSAVFGGCMDVVVRNDQAQDEVVVSCGTFNQSYVYHNPTARTTPTSWTQVITDPNMGRTSLAIAPGDQTYVYALAANGSSSALLAVYRSTDGGATFSAQHAYNSSNNVASVGDLLLSGTFVACPPSPAGSYAQGWYDQFITVDPVNRDRVWAAGVQLFRSSDGGVTWGSADRSYGFGIHPDNHVIAFPPNYDANTNKNAYVGNDGGLWRMANALATTTPNLSGANSICNGDAANNFSFTELNNGYGVTQFYYGAVFPNDNKYFGGTQDNGTDLGTDTAGPDGWSIINGGDGGDVAVDPTNANVLYAEYTGISIRKSTNGGSSFSDATTGISDGGALFISPFTMDPTAPQRLWTGGQFIWRTINAAGSWSQASTALVNSVSAIAVAPTNGNHVLVGTQDGTIYRNTAALSAGPSTTWPSVKPQSGYPSSVAFDPSDETKAWATYSTFGVTHVFKSTDGGASWMASASGLPDVPAHSIVVDPSQAGHLYVGTDLGVFVSIDGGANWAVENTGYANITTEYLVLNAPHLYAFTHGRGAWRVALAGATQPALSISDVTVIEGNTGTNAAVFAVSLDASSTASVAVQYATADGSATAPADYVSASGTLSFAPGMTTRTLSVTVNGDQTVEPAESFSVVLSNAVNATIADGTGTGTITNDDGGGAFAFSASSYTVTEAAAFATITVKRTGGTAGPVTVGYATSDGSATQPGDYTTASGTLTFGAGILAQTFKVLIGHDTVHEPNEVVVLKLQSPGLGATLGTPQTALLTITDNDPAPAVQLAAAAASVSEAGTAASLIVKRVGSTIGTSTVDYTTSDGTASAGSDYTLTSGTLTFGPGVAMQTVTVPVANDALPEGNETFKVSLTNPNGAVLGAVKTTTVAILDNDQGLSFSAASYTVAESTPKAIITVKRSGGTAGQLTVDYGITGGTATGGVDYTFASGTLVFGPGVVSKTFAVNIVNDTLDEGSETVSLALSNAIPATALKAPTAAVLTITDNEPVFQFSAANYTVSEAAPKATITVRRTGPTTGTASVDYSVSGGTATGGGTDYTLSSGTLTFGTSIAARTLAVNITPDTVDEPNETVILQLGNGTLPLGTPGTATLTITDNDLAGKAQFSAAAYSVAEGTGSTMATVTITRTGGTSSQATVVVTLTNGTAVAGVDYTNVGPVTVSFGLGQTSQTVQVPILNDGLNAGSKYLTLTLGSPGGGLTLGTLRSAQLWIADN